ncbi:hypothetical protein NG800_002285 [Epilithonimonas ginsengisoli]|uniref:LysM domain-containing protein n=1 Tax=Epilithonimonas ginsengisoli TaxID=1245592 RepID=A0ABU4JDH1_9FLAO|nr:MULTISPECIES: hypothetical protein [Chryseobacterium group]MBV6878695.1 hypothetical protein [Epilithonimonas sp. FP105]MDW8547721.1 hypothetical protein [Epilithonimonas ginsengisoli]OAH75944.1 hypothetical protein AXA65_02380 [Chryseobacterium sp. FP211-J200]
MDENILIYEVKPGETLDLIGAKIGMTGDQLKDFHNSHCEKMEKLWFNNLVGVKQIIIPKAYQSPEQLSLARKIELPSSSVTRDFYSNSYAVKETFVNTSQDDLELDYKVEVNFRSKKETNIADEIIDVSCTDFKKNGTKPDDKMSLISLACIEAIYPMSFIVPFQGKISGIFEFEKLKDKFRNERPDLEEFFIGEVYRSYLDKFQESLENRDHILKQFSSSLLYQVLFPKMEWFHKFDSWTEGFYFLQNSFLLKCSMRAEYNHEGTEVVETLLTGNIKDAFSLQEILRGISFDQESEELADGEIEIRYLTDKKTKKMLEAEASVTFRNEDELYRKQTLKITHDEKIS